VSLFIPSDNRPKPLAAPPIPMLADNISQMSFGERAALEGILGQLKPDLAIEIGTYEGGSLRFLALHCRHVHAFDLYDLVPDKSAFPNVTFHIGDSTQLLPPLLRELETTGQRVQLALVDGDHSAEGVRSDLVNLLDSPTCESTLILLHDTMNQETRAGIELAGLESHPKVVYHELDFISGYQFRGGHFDGQIWGGLGLVITGDRDTQGYSQAPGQTRYRKHYEVYSEEAQLREKLDVVQRELELSRGWLAAIQSSLSWRITAPLRRLKQRVQSGGPL